MKKWFRKRIAISERTVLVLTTDFYIDFADQIQIPSFHRERKRFRAKVEPETVAVRNSISEPTCSENYLKTSKF
jgi:hypothetical protein